MGDSDEGEENRHAAIKVRGAEGGEINGGLTLTGFGEGAGMDIADSEDITVEDGNIEGSGAGTGIRVSDSEDINARGVDIDDVERGIVSDNSDLTIQKVIFNQNTIGVEALVGSDMVFINCEFSDSEIADLLYHDEVRIAIYDTLAQQIMDLSGDETQVYHASEFTDSGHFLDEDKDLYQIAKAVRDVSGPEEKEEQTRRLMEELQSRWDAISGGLETVSQINAAIQLLKYILLAAVALGLLK